MHGRMVQVISILVTPQSKLKGYQTDGLEKAPSLAEKRRQYSPITLSTWKQL